MEKHGFVVHPHHPTFPRLEYQSSDAEVRLIDVDRLKGTDGLMQYW